VLEPALAELLEAVVLEPVDVLPNDGVLVVARDPEQPRVADVARVRADRVAGLVADDAPAGDAVQRTHDPVGADGGVGATAGRAAAGRDLDRAGAAGGSGVHADAEEVARALRRGEADARLQVAGVVVAGKRRSGRASHSRIRRDL